MSATPVCGSRDRPTPRPSDAVLSYLTIQGATPPEAVDAGSAAGFGAATVRVVPVGSSPPDADTIREIAMVDAARERMQETGVEITEVEYIRLDAGLRLTDVVPILDVGAQLGAASVNLMCFDPLEERAIERYAKISALAAERGLRVGLEFSAYSEVRRLEDAHRIVEAAGHPAGGVIVDALHLARSGGTPADVAALVARTPGRFPAVHLCDAPAVPRSQSPEALAEESREDRLLPGDGELPLLRLLAATAGSRAFVEAPVRASSGVGFAERARRAAAALADLGSQTADA